MTLYSYTWRIGGPRDHGVENKPGMTGCQVESSYL